MRIPIVKEGWVFIFGTPIVFGLLAAVCAGLGWVAPMWILIGFGLILTAFMFHFFRDPERVPPSNPDWVLSGADGRVRAIEHLRDPKYLGEEVLRISVYLSPMDVHVNRCPLGGQVGEHGYVPGKRILTRNNDSSQFNEHSHIQITNGQTQCLVHQIVGPIVRRVVYWLRTDQQIERGERLGLMKFGSRLDVYLPAADIEEILVTEGDKVQAGLTPLARLVKKS